MNCTGRRLIVAVWTAVLGMALLPAAPAFEDEVRRDEAASRPSAPEAVAASVGPSRTEIEEHLTALKKRLPDDSFTVVVESPFVVIGDGPALDVRRRAKDTVRWAIDRLKAAYFDKELPEVLEIWLFRNKDSYRKYCKDIFHENPSTPYGFYSHKHRALIMNIATGGGTLVHEIVHPYMFVNFPACPAWFNEGLASLYEQAGESKGRIVGYTNWRLGGLQEAIHRKRVPSFERLCSTTTEEFYEKDKGTNYAQARYLCYYLQQQGLLRKFYREFVAHHRDDPTGYRTLKQVLGRDDMDVFQRDWEKYTLGLEFP